MKAASFIITLVEIWLSVGGFIAFVFLVFGIDRIDEDSRGTYAFRPLIAPGVILLWPFVLWRWWQLEVGRFDELARYKPVRGTHAAAAVLLSLAIVCAAFLGLTSRQNWDAEFVPQRITEPEESPQ